MTILFTYVSFCRYVWEETPVHILSTIDDAKYTSVQIPKKNGVRTLCYPEPHSPLANYQERLLRAYLEKEPLPHCVKGFVKGSNYRSYMESHIGAKFFLRIDIKDFFPSITQNHIDEMVDDRFPKTPSDDKERIKNLLHKLLLYEGRLPQGACTSPAISNLVMTRLDLRIQKYCRRFKVEYG